MSYRLIEFAGRRPRVVGASLAVVVVAGLGLAWWSRDPWPARLILAPPDQASGSQGFTPDGRSFLTAGMGGALAWDLATGQSRRLATGREVWDTVLARDRRHSAGTVGPGAADRELVWVDAASGQIERRLPIPGRDVLHLGLLRDDTVLRVILNHALNHAGNLCEVLTWDLNSGAEERRRLALPASSFVVWACSPDGRWLVWVEGSPPHNIEIWDIAADRASGTLRRTSPARPDSISGNRFTPDGRTLIVTRADNQAEVWNLAERRLVRVISIPPAEPGWRTLAIAPDGRTFLATTGLQGAPPSAPAWLVALLGMVGVRLPSRGGEVALIDLATGQTLARSRTSDLAEFTPDGRSIITHELNGTFAVRPVPAPSTPK